MTHIPEDPELIDILPIEASMSGRNSVYQFCEYRQQQVSYAVCLHTLKRIEDGTIPRDQFTECQRAYTHDTCPAKKMRAQEVAAGHALFFIPRPRHITDPVVKGVTSPDGAASSGRYDMSNESYARGWAMAGRDGYSTDAPVKRSKPTRNIGPIKKTGFVTEGMADVVNVLMKENADSKKAEPVKAVEPTAEAPNPNRPFPGESTADFIKRRAKQKV